MKKWYKDPGAVLDYEINWSKWLVAGDSLASRTVTVPAGLTVDSAVLGGDKVTIWLSGGTAGTSYVVTCRITTVGGRTDERSFRIVVEDR